MGDDLDAGAAGGSVLVVDDDADVRRALEAVLTERGLAVLGAADGREGLELFCRERPRLVLADLEMPGMRGRELLRRVRSVDPGAAVVLMTGYATLDQAVAAMQEGASDFLLKPVAIDRLLETVRRSLGRKERAADPGHCWTGRGGGTAVAGVREAGPGASLLFAVEALPGDGDAVLTATILAEALTGLGPAVRAPERLLALAARATVDALEGTAAGRVAVAVARADGDGGVLELAVAGSVARRWRRGEGCGLGDAGAVLSLVSPPRYQAGERRDHDVEAGDVLVLATPSLLRLAGGAGVLDRLAAGAGAGGSWADLAAALERLGQAAPADLARGAALVAWRLERRS
jgi:CheY-like chemotaxis protein